MFGSYSPGKRQFTVEIVGDYRLWAFCHQLATTLCIPMPDYR